MMRVLLTNDDGVHAEGIHCLAALLSHHCEVLVVAPESPNSATSHCITLHKPLRLTEVKRLGVECGAAREIAAYACSGTPSDCVMLGALHLWQSTPPDLVVSGINEGVNVAQDLTYSGTVGGALEGAICGIPSIAVSLAGDQHMPLPSAARILEAIVLALVYGRRFAWTQAALDQISQLSPAPDLPAWDLSPNALPLDDTQSCPPPGGWQPPGLPATLCLNINIPDMEPQHVRGVCWTRAGYREYRDVVRATADPRGRAYYWIAGEKVTDGDTPGTDTYALAHGSISVTPITYDITAVADLTPLKAWLRERDRR